MNKKQDVLLSSIIHLSDEMYKIYTDKERVESKAWKMIRDYAVDILGEEIVKSINKNELH